MDEIEVNLEVCTLYKGVPYGLAIISYTDDDDDLGDSFKGVGVFRDGTLHNSPFTFAWHNGGGESFSKMIDGRPSDSHYHTLFNKNGAFAHVDSTV